MVAQECLKPLGSEVVALPNRFSLKRSCWPRW